MELIRKKKFLPLTCNVKFLDNFVKVSDMQLKDPECTELARSIVIIMCFFFKSMSSLISCNGGSLWVFCPFTFLHIMPMVSMVVVFFTVQLITTFSPSTTSRTFDCRSYLCMFWLCFFMETEIMISVNYMKRLTNSELYNHVYTYCNISVLLQSIYHWHYIFFQQIQSK